MAAAHRLSDSEGTSEFLSDEESEVSRSPPVDGFQGRMSPFFGDDIFEHAQSNHKLAGTLSGRRPDEHSLDYSLSRSPSPRTQHSNAFARGSDALERRSSVSIRRAPTPPEEHQQEELMLNRTKSMAASKVTPVELVSRGNKGGSGAVAGGHKTSPFAASSSRPPVAPLHHHPHRPSPPLHHGGGGDGDAPAAGNKESEQLMDLSEQDMREIEEINKQSPALRKHRPASGTLRGNAEPHPPGTPPPATPPPASRRLVSRTGTMADLLSKGNRFPASKEPGLHGVQSSASTSTLFDDDPGEDDLEKNLGDGIVPSATASVATTNTANGGRRTDVNAPSRLKPMHNLPAPAGRRVTLRTMPLDMRFKNKGDDEEFGGVVPGQDDDTKRERPTPLMTLPPHLVQLSPRARFWILLVVLLVAGFCFAISSYMISILASRTLPQDWTVTGSLTVQGTTAEGLAVDIPPESGLAPGFLLLKPSAFSSSFSGVSTRGAAAGASSSSSVFSGDQSDSRSVTVSPASSLHSFSLSTQQSTGRLHLLVHNATSASSSIKSTVAQSMTSWGATGMDVASELALPDSQLIFGRYTYGNSSLGATIDTTTDPSQLTLKSLLSPITSEPMHITLSPASGRVQLDGSLCIRAASSTGAYTCLDLFNGSLSTTLDFIFENTNGGVTVKPDNGDLLFDAKRVELSPGTGDFRFEGPTTGNVVLAPGAGQQVSVEGALSSSTSLQSPLVMANEVRSTAASNSLTLNGQSGEVIFSGAQLTLPNNARILSNSGDLELRPGGSSSVQVTGSLTSTVSVTTPSATVTTIQSSGTNTLSLTSANGEISLGSSLRRSAGNFDLIANSGSVVLQPSSSTVSMVGNRLEASSSLTLASSSGAVQLSPNAVTSNVEVNSNTLRGNPGGASAFTISSSSNAISLAPASGTLSTTASTFSATGALTLQAAAGALSLQPSSGVVSLVGSTLANTAGAFQLQSATGNDLELRAPAGQAVRVTGSSTTLIVGDATTFATLTTSTSPRVVSSGTFNVVLGSGAMTVSGGSNTMVVGNSGGSSLQLNAGTLGLSSTGPSTGEGVGLELAPANGNVRIRGGTNTLSVNGLASLSGSTQGSLALTNSAGNSTTFTPSSVSMLGSFAFDPQDSSKYYNTTINVNSQWTMNFKGSADAGSFRLHPGPTGTSVTRDWSIAIIGQQFQIMHFRNGYWLSFMELRPATNNFFFRGIQVSSSSLRYKYEVENMPTEGILERVLQLQGVTYRKYDDPTRQKQAGFIAEDTAELFPLEVFRDEQGRPDAIAYEHFIPYLVESIKALNAKVQTTNQQMQQMRAELDELHACGCSSSSSSSSSSS